MTYRNSVDDQPDLVPSTIDRFKEEDIKGSS